MDKEKLIEWLERRVLSYRDNKDFYGCLHLDVRATEINAILEAISNDEIV